MKKVILIDSHALIHRAYHALPPLTMSSGEPGQAVYGFSSILLRMLRELRPDYAAAAFDLPGPTFRHERYDGYKAHRPKAPDDLIVQFQKVREVLGAFHIPTFDKEGYEADDIIGTLAKKLSHEKEIETIIVTGDMDALQLIHPRLRVWTMKKGITETALYDEEAVRERYGISPPQIADLKALKGDPSDNIKGVKGIGEKTAAGLIQRFGSVEGIYSALEKGGSDISPSVAAKLAEGKKDAYMSLDLARINADVPIEFELKNIAWGNGKYNDEIREIFRKFGFASLVKRLDQPESGSDTSEKKTGKRKKNAEAQGSLLDVSLIQSGSLPSLSSLKEFDVFTAIGAGAMFGLCFFPPANLFLIAPSGDVRGVSPALLKEAAVRRFFESGRFAAHDGKSIIRFLSARGIGIGEIVFDVMIAGYVIESNLRDFSYASIAARELGESFPNPTEALGSFFEAKKRLEARIALLGLEKVYYEIEIPLIPVLARMEERGIKINTKFLAIMREKIDRELETLTEKIYAIAGKPFNINSPQQLSVILFETLGMNSLGLRKTAKGGVVSTRESELEKLKDQHPIVGEILKYRALAKLKTTYIDVLPKLADPDTGRIHTTFNQAGASTGRLSSLNPNLQNIPIMSEYGREVRRAFVAEKGFLLCSFDYSQIELRVAAHIAHDEKMIQAFREGLDIHRMTAAEIYNVPLEKVTLPLRRAAKTLNFGVLYGMGPHAFSEATGMPVGEARKFIEDYFRNFSGIREYVERTKTFARENGFVKTLFGRRRPIPEIYSGNFREKREAERMAVNMPIQGTATGDIVKIAMVKVDEWIRKEKRENDIRMLLQVHDELVFEIRESAAREAAPRIKEIMENVDMLDVPLLVDVHIGENWGK